MFVSCRHFFSNLKVLRESKTSKIRLKIKIFSFLGTDSSIFFQRCSLWNPFSWGKTNFSYFILFYFILKWTICTFTLLAFHVHCQILFRILPYLHPWACSHRKIHKERKRSFKWGGFHFDFRSASRNFHLSIFNHGTISQWFRLQPLSLPSSHRIINTIGFP